MNHTYPEPVLQATCLHLDEQGPFLERGYAVRAVPDVDKHDSLHDLWLFAGEEALPELTYRDHMCKPVTSLEFHDQSHDARVRELLEMALADLREQDAKRIARSPTMPADRAAFDQRAVRFASGLLDMHPHRVTLHFHKRFYSQEQANWILGRGPRTNTVGITFDRLDLGARTMLVFEEVDRVGHKDRRLYMEGYCGGKAAGILDSPDITSRTQLLQQLTQDDETSWRRRPLPTPMTFGY